MYVATKVVVGRLSSATIYRKVHEYGIITARS
jgi:hypothetical protein